MATIMPTHFSYMRERIGKFGYCSELKKSVFEMYCNASAASHTTFHPSDTCVNLVNDQWICSSSCMSIVYTTFCLINCFLLLYFLCVCGNNSLKLMRFWTWYESPIGLTVCVWDQRHQWLITAILLRQLNYS